MMVEGDSVDLDLTIGDAFPPNYVPIEDIHAEPVLLRLVWCAKYWQLERVTLRKPDFIIHSGDKAVTNLLIGIGAVVGGVLVVVDDRVVWVDKSAE
jgi:hypothetical protein